MKTWFVTTQAGDACHYWIVLADDAAQAAAFFGDVVIHVSDDVSAELAAHYRGIALLATP